MSKKPKIQSPTGMADILPEDQVYFNKIYEVVSHIADFYGFRKIDTPIIEHTEVFEKGLEFLPIL
jgi:histidyl-tRNA synthetase